MDYFKYIEWAAIFLGACFLAVGLFYIKRISSFRDYPVAQWKGLFVLVLLFIFGYFSFGVLTYKQPTGLSLLIVSFVFFLGGLFVFVIARLSFKTIVQVKEMERLKDAVERDDLTGLYNKKICL